MSSNWTVDGVVWGEPKADGEHDGKPVVKFWVIHHPDGPAKSTIEVSPAVCRKQQHVIVLAYAADVAGKISPGEPVRVVGRIGGVQTRQSSGHVTVHPIIVQAGRVEQPEGKWMNWAELSGPVLDESKVVPHPVGKKPRVNFDALVDGVLFKVAIDGQPMADFRAVNPPGCKEIVAPRQIDGPLTVGTLKGEPTLDMSWPPEVTMGTYVDVAPSPPGI